MDIWNGSRITKVKMQCGRVLVSIQMKYGERWGTTIGGFESESCEFPREYDLEYEFDEDERVVAANATHNIYINSFTLVTNKRVLGTCGTTGGDTVKETEGRQLKFISGRGGCYTDQLRLHWDE